MIVPEVIRNAERLALAPASLFALAAVADGRATRVDPAHLEVLRRAEMIEGRQVGPDLEPVARAVNEARCEVTVDLDADRLTGWISSEMVVLLAPIADDDTRVDVMAGPTTHLPLLLSELTRLGPRPVMHRGAVVELAEEGLPGLLASAPEDLATAADADGVDDPRTAGAIAALVESYRGRWRVAVHWGGEQTQMRAVEALESEQGWWRLERVGGRAILSATDATDLYRGFTALLPTENELGA